MARAPGASSEGTWRIRGGGLPWGRRTLVMGILNVTPDSFSDGGRFLDTAAAVCHGIGMARAGAHVIDVGGESTRPGSDPVAIDEELRRVLPVIEALSTKGKAPISIDTTKAEVAQRALEAGASIVNDISAGRFDEGMLPLVAKAEAGYVVMHMIGTPRTMQANPRYDDVVREVHAFLAERVAACEQAGIPRESIAVDPGIGFGKSVDHNLQLLRDLGAFASFGAPILVGPSRKSFIGTVLDRPVDDRLWGTTAVVAVAVCRGAHAVRVHDVPEMVQITRMTDAILEAP